MRALEALESPDTERPLAIVIHQNTMGLAGYKLINQLFVKERLRGIPILLLIPRLSESNHQQYTSLHELIDCFAMPIAPEPFDQYLTSLLVANKFEAQVLEHLQDGERVLAKPNEALIGLDESGRIRFANATAFVLLRTSPGRLYGCFAESLFAAGDDNLISQWADHPIKKVCNSEQILQIEQTQVVTAQGTSLYVKMAVVPVTLTPLTLAVAFEQLQSPEGARLELEQQQNQGYDPVTGLMDETGFRAVVQTWISKQPKSSLRFAVFMIELVHFEHIDQELGHGVGARVLQDVVGRLKQNLRLLDRLSRVDHGRFALLLCDLESHIAAHVIARKLIQAMQEPFLCAGYELRLGSCMGIALYPDCGAVVTTLLQNAQQALHAAKLIGANTSQFFTAAMNQTTLTVLEQETAFHKALKNGQVEIDHQNIEIESDPQHQFVHGLQMTTLSWPNESFGVSSAGEVLQLVERYGAFGGAQLLFERLGQIHQRLFAHNQVKVLVPVSVWGLCRCALSQVYQKASQLPAERIIWVLFGPNLNRHSQAQVQQLQELHGQGFGFGLLVEAIEPSLALLSSELPLDLVVLPKLEQTMTDRRSLGMRTIVGMAEALAIAICYR